METTHLYACWNSSSMRCIELSGKHPSNSISEFCGSASSEKIQQLKFFSKFPITYATVDWVLQLSARIIRLLLWYSMIAHLWNSESFELRGNMHATACVFDSDKGSQVSGPQISSFAWLMNYLLLCSLYKFNIDLNAWKNSVNQNSTLFLEETNSA